MKHIPCKVFGHDLEITRHVTYHVKEYTCKNCKEEFTTNVNGTLTKLTPKFKEINDVLERIHHKKHRVKLKKKPTNPELLVFSH